MTPSTPSQLSPRTRHNVPVAHNLHLAGHTGPMTAVAHVGRHRVTSETPQHRTVRALVAQHAGDTR